MHLPSSYYSSLLADYRARRDFLLPVLRELGFEVFEPHGAYYVMTGISGFGYGSDLEFADYLVREVGVATVPGSSFYHDPAPWKDQIRFAYPKRLETLERAADLLKTLVRLPAPEGQSRSRHDGFATSWDVTLAHICSMRIEISRIAGLPLPQFGVG